MENIRLFVSLPLEPRLAQVIFNNFLKVELPWDKIRPVTPELMHLTIKFLGDVPLEYVPQVIEALETVKPNLGSLELETVGPVIFQPSHPQVLAIAIKPNQKLEEIHRLVEDALWQANLSNKDMRRFSAHLTLARVKAAVEAQEFSAFNQMPAEHVWSNTYFALQESILTKKGPQYNILQTFDL